MGVAYGSLSNSSEMESNVILDKKKMEVQVRSEGDGMENVTFTETSHSKVKFQQPLVTNPTAPYANSFPLSAGKRKEPKFVPYEPYKAAVSPMLADLSKKNKAHLSKVEIDPNIVKPLVSKVIAEAKVFHGSEENSLKDIKLHNNNNILHKEHLCDKTEQSSWEAEKVLLEKKIEELEKEKEKLKQEFNVQVKVNADLKKLLVASIGEDFQVKVQYMSEDKAKLGEHVLSYSQQLAKCNEELEKLSVQCDIWKSKFEASSLLVDELATWKVALSRKFNEAMEALQGLMKEHEGIYADVMTSFRVLQQMQEAFNPTVKRDVFSDHAFWNICQLANATKNLSLDIKSHLLGNLSLSPKLTDKLENVPCLTSAEQLAQKVISNATILPKITNFELENERKKKPGVQACHVLPHVCSHEQISNGCSNCSGEILLV